MAKNKPLYVVGVDGGTTKTIVLVADDQGRILDAARGGNTNWVGPDVDVPMRIVGDIVREALKQLGLRGEDVAAGVFGLAGADWPEDHERRREALEKEKIARLVIVKNDSLVGWRAGTRGRYGVVIAAGTATNTAIIPPDGPEWCYGYYALFGGAEDVARDAVFAVLRAEDGRGAPTSLTALVLEKLRYSSPKDLLMVAVMNSFDREEVRSLCPLVFEAADAGDEAAKDIIIKQAEALAEYATAGIRRFKMQELEFDVVLSGSLFKGRGSLLTDTITKAINNVAPRARIVRPRYEPAVGGILLAYDALGIAVTDEMYDNLARTAPGADFFSTADGTGSDSSRDGAHS